MPEEEFLSVQQAAKELDIAVTTMRQHCQHGHLGRKHGRDWLITRQELEAFRQERRKPGRPTKRAG